MTLKDDIQAVITEARAEMGIAILHLETGEKVEINADTPFPMASVFKIPILAAAFHQLTERRFDLADRRSLRPEDKSTGSGILPFFEAGLSPTIHDLLTLMIIISDNTATDMTIDRLGGPAAIESYMHQLGLNEIYFKFNCKTLLKTLLPEGDYTLEEMEKLFYEREYPADSLAFSRGPDNNISTPRAMTRLLQMIYNAEFVDRAASDQMLAILLKQQLNDRLPRFLPPGTKCAHKTGTIGGIRNDSGIIYISDSVHVAVTIFVSWDNLAVWKKPVEERARIFEIETAMGKIGRLVYDHYSK